MAKSSFERRLDEVLKRPVPTADVRAILPHDLTKLTAEQMAWCVAYHAALPLREIRRRQDLTDRQIGMAWQQQNDFALTNLRVREEILRRAAERKLAAGRLPRRQHLALCRRGR